MDQQAETARIERRQAELRTFVERSRVFAERQGLSMQPLLERVQNSPPPWTFVVGSMLGAIMLVGVGFLIGKIS
ncbi:MAG: hypothetical protein J0I54_12145 [Bosea sp.]|uniref:hypothetical protein n=1 Tax=unclassified Bosea (in: a-proteobacteria) TaxID=2653178 RepID=UPI00095F151D|nr:MULTISPECIES: hypothetical protein [unclassified Bosea (in: a-proteobacteria)]MBN9457370.1 hypothetical protein [Bosea sp. (in: a-proteobacteria)]OJV09642.1 MAG: hypothetical protein BGO20_02960 [Bosea sp. 67-29]